MYWRFFLQLIVLPGELVSRSGRSLLHPNDIWIVGGIDPTGVEYVLEPVSFDQRGCGIWVRPALRLDVTIGEGKRPCAVVVVGGEIGKTNALGIIRVSIHLDPEIA